MSTVDQDIRCGGLKLPVNRGAPRRYGRVLADE
jgi:hypothetical protein